jgi:hypothetical protein
MNSNRKALIVVLAVVFVGAGATIAFYAISGGRTTTTTLAAGCVKPAGGFLVIASGTGYNDSMGHGVPEKNWPILNVTQGQTVNITVCNTDFQAHGFQVTYYYDSSLITVVPGQVLHVSFVANKPGQFRIYCNIFCSIHWAMQNGLLNVVPA